MAERHEAGNVMGVLRPEKRNSITRLKAESPRSRGGFRTGDAEVLSAKRTRS